MGWFCLAGRRLSANILRKKIYSLMTAILRLKLLKIVFCYWLADWTFDDKPSSGMSARLNMSGMAGSLLFLILS